MTTLEKIQEAQSTLAKLQLQYSDNTREWFALAAAVELVRVAWYEVSGDADTAREKLTDNTARAMADYERFTARDDAAKFDRMADENTKRIKRGKG